MKTVVYLVRHSEPFDIHRGIEKISDGLLLSNIKTPLSINGETLADIVSENQEFKNLDVVWSSNYVRTMSTAKYFAFKNNIKVNIDEKLNERVYGINSWNELPNDFEIHQFNDENYKIGNGESQKEVNDRLYFTIKGIINENIGKRILIVGHSTATMFLLGKWCKININGNYIFNGKVFFDGKWKYCQTFKLIFENEKLVDILEIKL